MAEVLLSTLADALGGPVVADATFTATATRARAVGDGVVANKTITVPVVQGVPSEPILLDHSGVDWCWRLRVVFPPIGVRIDRTVAVPDVPSVEWADLVDVDPATLLPAESAVPAWTAAVGQVAAVLADTETARDGAVTAQGLSEAARDAAVIARGIAEIARDGAVVAQGASEDARDQSQVYAANTVELQDTTFTALIADPESATRAQLNATFVSPLKDALSNAVNGLYLPSQTCLFKWRQRRSLTVTGAQQAHVAIIGDSIADGAAVTSPRPVNSWPGVLRAMLARQYGDAGTGLVIMDKNLRANPTRDPRVTWVGAITDLAAGFHKQACARIDGPGGSPTNYVMFTPEQAVEAFTVWNLKGAGGANRYQIDSDTTKTFRNVPHVYSDVQPRAGDNAGHYVQTMHATSKGVHTLKVWPDSAAAGYDLFLTAVEGFNDDPGTFRVSNPSISGRSLWSLFGGASMNDEVVAWAGLPLIDMLRADLLVVALGVNDWLTGVSVSDAKAWLKILVQRQRGSGAAPGGGTKANGDVMLLWNPQPDLSTLGPSVGGATWDQYRAMFYEVADEEDVALLDLGMRWGGFDNADSLGFYLPADHIHPIDAPTRDMAVAVHSALHV